MNASDLKRHSVILVSIPIAAALAVMIDSALALEVTGSILYLPVIWLAYRSKRSTVIYLRDCRCLLIHGSRRTAHLATCS